MGDARALERRLRGDAPPPRRLERDAAGYPPGLLDLPDPPDVLYVAGDLPERGRAVAIVGSRAASSYGRAQAHALAGDLARLGLAVVSGLAQGIDAAAHEGTLAAGGHAVAVLPGGLDAITPPGHRALARAIARAGALASETASGPPRFASRFLARNRLIAALTSATVVVEAAERSGALSTAAWARRLGRALFAVPGDVDRPTSRGANALLRAGARPCLHAGDVVDALAGATGGDPATPEARVLAALDARPRAAEELARRAGLAVDDTLAALTALEWAGAALAHAGPRWSRSPR